MRRFIHILTLLFITYSNIAAQDFLHKAEIPKVDSSGYYHIFLSPDVTSKLNYKFSDFRIYDNNKLEIPYIRLAEDELFKTAKSNVIRILQNEYRRVKKHTFLLLQNHKLRKISNLVIIVDNPMNAEAWVNISGSNDMKNWSLLKNNSRYMPEFSDSTTAEIRITDLPESEFEYFRIFIFDFNKITFNVHKVLNFEIEKIIPAQKTEEK